MTTSGVGHAVVGGRAPHALSSARLAALGWGNGVLTTSEAPLADRSETGATAPPSPGARQGAHALDPTPVLGRAAPDALSPDLTDALAILDAHRLVRAGVRRCQRRVRALAGGGAVSGGDDPADRILDRALYDRFLLGAIGGELGAALSRLRQRLPRPVVEELVEPVPLAALQHDVLVDRISGESWPRIAQAHTRGDRGTAVRAFRQAAARVGATAAVLAALQDGPGSDTADVARRTGLSVRMVHAIRRHLAMRERGGPGGPPQRPPARGSANASAADAGRIPIPRRVADRPNPRPLAKPCPLGGVPGQGDWGAWCLLQVRAGSELRVKVTLERSLGDLVRCRTLRTQPTPREAEGYLAVACRDQQALQETIRDLPGVVGWVAGTDLPFMHSGQGSQRRDVSGADDADRPAAAWFDPRRERP